MIHGVAAQARWRDFREALTVSGQPGSFAIAGQNADLIFRERLIAAAGSYALAGQAAGFKFADFEIAANAAAYTTSGQSASLIKPLTATALTHTTAETGVTGTSKSFTAVDIGTATADRKIVLLVGKLAASVTITAASLLPNDDSNLSKTGAITLLGGNGSTSHYYSIVFSVPDNYSTATITLTFSGTTARDLHTHAVLVTGDLVSTTATAYQSSGTGTSASVSNVTTQDNGLAFGMISVGSAGSSYNWSVLTKLADGATSNSTEQTYAAAKTTGATISPSLSWTGSANYRLLVAVYR